MSEQRASLRGKSKPPVTCGNCGAAITFAPGQLVGNPETLAIVRRYRDALERIDRLQPPQADRTAQRIAREALNAS